MTTRFRAHAVRAAALIAPVAMMLAVPAAPVAAAAPGIRIVSVSSENVKSGESVRVKFRATNNERRKETVFVAVSGGLRCTAGCSASKDLGAGQSETFTATVVAPKVNTGEISGRNLAVSIRIGTQTAFDHKMIYVHGGDQPSSAVSRVAGRVRDTGGKAIGGATVIIQDSAGNSRRTTSDRRGRFSVRSSAGKPIAAGPITVVADKDGYRAARATAQGAAGGTATVQLTLTAAPTPSKTPPSPSAVASRPAAADEPVTTESSAEAPPATAQTAGDDGGSSPLLTLLGGLLVAAGLGALVRVLIRRRRSVETRNPHVPAPNAPFGADAPTAVLRTVPPGGRSFGGS